MNDNISRQAALDALWELRRSLQMMDNSQGADITMRGVFLAEKKIEALPSTDIEQAKSEHYKQTNKQREFVDLISRQAALAYPLSWDHYDKEHGNRHFICGVESYREYIESLPSTDRTGHWIDRIEEHGDSIGIYPWEVFKCSECGHLTAGNEYKFCPHCGADMRGENDERKQMGL